MRTQTKQAQHTPTPYSIGEDGDIFVEGGCIATVVGAAEGTPQGKANVAFIVKSCNSHESMYGLLVDLLVNLENGRVSYGDENENAIRQVKEVLEHAEGRSA